ncbi:hypothetical protein JCM10213_006131 [Rhodosporidiobolus nylandii]
MDHNNQPVRVGIVGTGLAGLAAAYLLQTPNARREDGTLISWEVHLLEKNDQLGMDSASISVRTGKGEKGGEETRVDVPMRSINGGSHSRVKRLYDRLGVPLVQSEFSYSFSTLSSAVSSSAPPPPPSSSAPPSPSPPPASPTGESDATPSPPDTPLPSYSASFSPSPSSGFPSSSSTPAALSASQSRPPQTTHLLYSGSSGLSWPPLPFPSHLSTPTSTFRARVSHLLSSATLALSYIYLLLLSMLYVSLSLSRPTPLPSSSPTSTLKRRFIQLCGVASEPLDAWLERHRVSRGMSQLTRVLMAAVCTVGVEQAGRMPVGEVLEYISSTFLSPHFVTHPSFGVRGIVRALVAPIPPAQVHTGVTISRIAPVAPGEDGRGGYEVFFSRRSSSPSSEEKAEEKEEEILRVDHLILATQADQAASLLRTLLPSSSLSSPPSAENRPLARILTALDSFTYARTLVVTHTDSSLLPPAKADRRDLNLAVFSSPLPGAAREKQERSEKAGEEDAGDTVVEPGNVQTTHILPFSLSHPLSPSLPHSNSSSHNSLPILQTTNPLVPPSPSSVLSSTWFTRAVVNPVSQGFVPLFAPSAGGTLQGLSLGCVGQVGHVGQVEQVGQGGRSEGGERKDGRAGVWFTGSYAAPGVPLLEGCVESAEGVVAGIIAREVRGRGRARRGAARGG